MKNNSLIRSLLLVLVVFAFVNLNAQTTVLFQNFEVSKTVSPAGWSQQLTASAPKNKGWEFNNKYPGALATYVPAHTYYTFVDDYDYNTTLVSNNDTLYSPVMNCTGLTHVFVSFDAMFYIYNGYETGTLAVSNDGGKTWTSAGDIPNNSFTWQDSLVFDISLVAANQPNVKIAFAYYDGVPNPYGAPGVGMAIDNIDVFAPVAYDLGVASQNLPFLMQVGSAYTFTGVINNYGGDSVVSMRLNYSVNGGPIKSDNITGITGFNPLTSYNFTHNVSYTPPAAGNYTVKIWADQLNGSFADQFHSNDTLVANFTALDTIQPKVALYEDVVGQSCYYCMLSAPNVDSVSTTNKSIVNVIHYHVPYPGPPDYMFDNNQTLGNAMIKYYNVQGTPTAELDGQYLYPGALAAPQDFSTPNVAQEVNWGSAFKISISSCTYATSTNTYALTATIKSYGNFPAGLSAKVALVVDSLYYYVDYSSDDPKSSFVPPLGTTSAANGGSPDYLYPYTMKFTDVVENMFPSSTGTTLGAFTAGSTQTINVTWKKNHPWSDSAKQYPYDSSATSHMVVFVQSNAGVVSAGIPAQLVLQSASLPVTSIVGIQELANGVSFNMYPNPTDGNTSIVYSLPEEQNVNIAVYNMLGDQVYSANQGKTASGQHTVVIDGSNLASGVYMVKFTTDNASTTQKLVIQK